MTAIYVYDSRQQYQCPIFTVYDESRIVTILSSAFPDVPPEAAHVSYVRLHPYDEGDPYVGMGSDPTNRVMSRQPQPRKK